MGKTGKIRMPNNFDVHSDVEFKNRLDEVRQNILYPFVKKEDKLKCYFAGPWFDDRANAIYEVCKNIISQIPEMTRCYDFYFPKDNNFETPQITFNENVKQIQDCDVVLALVSRKDVGTAWEIGMAFAAGKKIYLLGYDETTFLSHTNVMLAFTGSCLTIDKLGKFVTGNMVSGDYIDIPNVWEGIE